MPTDDSLPPSVCPSSDADVLQTSKSTVVRVGQESVVQEDPLSSDVHALCRLCARILLRCLKEQDERVMKRLSLPFADSDHTSGENS